MRQPSTVRKIAFAGPFTAQVRLSDNVETIGDRTAYAIDGWHSIGQAVVISPVMLTVSCTFSLEALADLEHAGLQLRGARFVAWSFCCWTWRSISTRMATLGAAMPL